MKLLAFTSLGLGVGAVYSMLTNPGPLTVLLCVVSFITAFYVEYLKVQP